MWIATSLDQILSPTVVALGNFDGVHRGHQQVIRELSHDSSVGEHLSVVSFDPHPQEFFSGQPRTLLTPLPEKTEQLVQLGVQQLVLLPFDTALSRLSPQAFFDEILVQHLKARVISVGFNFRFGHQRVGTVEDLKTLAAERGIQVKIAAPQLFNAARISSSAIRQALLEGDIPLANRLLGRCYRLIGEVITGQQLARTLGFPTANLQVPGEKFLPRSGVYAVQVKSQVLAQPEIGVMNIGVRPTVTGEGKQTKPTIEVHLLNWTGDLYGQTLEIELERFLRPEQKFASLDDLKAQIRLDCEAARQVQQSPARV